MYSRGDLSEPEWRNKFGFTKDTKGRARGTRGLIARILDQVSGEI